MADREAREFESRQEAQMGEYVSEAHGLRDLYMSTSQGGKWVWRCACSTGDARTERSQAVAAYEAHMLEVRHGD